ncbi:acetyl-CoA carboxylase carboxyl transferase subunit beta [Saccharothrix tamanrassetensis]|uniref:Multifunctional fusion protein n=1 Tax=Saccharothrix tamanrassetensis TaxID=1051531 RepID=A0A841CU49_9PSEU|nr:acetyl-CoA carboxylase carboxyl transferase subunit beta [Saccharothrix tamanrassetensis]
MFGPRWWRDAGVCPECGHHDRLTAAQRVDSLLDPGSVESIGAQVGAVDVLSFVDREPYSVRLDRARAATGMREAVLAAAGRLDGIPVVVAAMDFRFLGGSLGAGAGELITLAAERALVERAPLVLVTASGGARMQEGAISLMQMAKTSAALAALDEAGVPTVCLVTDPTYGGVAASFATLCDVVVAEPRARFGFAGRRVVEQTIGQELPDDFQTAEFLLAHGLLDRIVPRDRLRAELAVLLSAMGPEARAGRPSGTGSAGNGPAGNGPAGNGPAGNGPAGNGSAGNGSGVRNGSSGAGAERLSELVIGDPGRLPERDAHEVVRLARAVGRPTTLDYARTVFTDFVELHGDRMSADCPAIVGGVARLGGVPVVLIGHQKGHDARELAKRSFGMPSPAGYRKAARLMRLAAKLGLPVVTLVDTPGAHPGAEAEEQGQAHAIAENLRLMSSLPVPVVTVVTGEGGSGGALALAVANRVLSLADGVYSVISPEGCAAILWHDRSAAPLASAALRLTARDLVALGVVDGVVPENADRTTVSDGLRPALSAALRELAHLGPDELVADRRARFRAFGRDHTSELRLVEGATP